MIDLLVHCCFVFFGANSNFIGVLQRVSRLGLFNWGSWIVRVETA